MKKQKMAVLALCGALTCGGVIGGAYALFSGNTAATENSFEIVAGAAGETDASKVGYITEDGWDAAVDADANYAKGLMANSTITKDPKFTSNAEYEAYVVMKVDIPAVSMKVGEDATAKVQDVFVPGTLGTNWALKQSDVATTAGTNSSYYYVYADTLEKNDETSELFQEMTVPNITELAVTLEDTVDVTAYIIQAEGHDSADAAFTAIYNSINPSN